MKVPYSWLKELVEIDIPIDELAESLSIAGFEVESIEDLSKKAEGVVVGFVEKIDKHPNANKLNICQVRLNEESTSQIVCGASNIREGVHVLVAIPGAKLSAINLEIKSSNLRGVRSDGMICSLGELGIESEDEGIAIIEDMSKQIPSIGQSVKGFLDLDDHILDLAITANRPDGMSLVGIAREVSALTERNLNIPVIENNHKQDLFKPNYIDHSAIDESCIYSLTRIDNLDTSKESPLWLKSRLEKCGIKSINLIVDLTNYVQLEQGHPLHAFDLEALEKITKKTVKEKDFGVRKAKNSEKLIALDGKEYKLNKHITIITCHDIPVAIAGIIGGLDSSVCSTTKSVILECALFTATSVRISSRNLGIRTESSSRYEKGISGKTTIPSLIRYLDLLNEQCEIKCSKTFIDKLHKEDNKQIHLRKQRINKILGSLKKSLNIDSTNMNIDLEANNYIKDEEIETKLSLLGCNYSKKGNDWDVDIPEYRKLDLMREIDLIEEIARLIGYDKFETNLPNPLKPGGLNRLQKTERKLRQSLSGAGFQEITTFSLVPKNDEKDRIPISNPLLVETSHLRDNLWQELLNICERNITAGKDGCWVYEIGSIYSKIKDGIVESKKLSGVISGERRFEKWSTGGKKKRLSYYEARGLLHQAFKGLKLDLIDKQLTESKILHPGRSATLYLEGKPIGTFGQIHPLMLENFHLNNETYLFDIELKPIFNSCTRNNKYCITYKSFPTVPFMERDISIVLEKSITSTEIVNLIRKSGKPYLEDVELIDRYEGDNLGAGKVSQAFRIRYRDKNKTLTESDINPIHEKIRGSLTQKLQAELRS